MATQYGTWVSYAGTARLLLAIILLDGLRAAGAARAHRQSPASQPHHDGDPDCGGRPVRRRLHRHPAWPRGTAVCGVIAAMAAPMIFELPFDLIVMARTYPPVPPDPVLYRTLFFAPLFLVELTTLSLLAVSPLVKLSRPAFFCLALMLLVFVTALSLFFPEWFTRWCRSQPDPGIEQAADASELQPQAA
jgi:hypothetical protein